MTPVRNQVHFRNQVHNQVLGQIRDPVRVQVYSRDKDQVWNQVRNPVRDQVCFQVRIQVWNKV